MSERCAYCQGERLMAPVEPLELGGAVICGTCGGLHIADVRIEDREPHRGEATRFTRVGFIRVPTREESTELRQIPAVKDALHAFDLVMLEDSVRAAARKPKRKLRLPTQTLRGPDA